MWGSTSFPPLLKKNPPTTGLTFVDALERTDASEAGVIVSRQVPCTFRIVIAPVSVCYPLEAQFCPLKHVFAR